MADPLQPDQHWTCPECRSTELLFDRSICWCGTMHNYCGDCGTQAEDCDLGQGACALCGRDPAAGFATVGNERYCHGDGDLEPTCYMRAQARLAKEECEDALSASEASEEKA